MTYSPTVGRSSVRVMLSAATGQKLPIFTRDISQAYVPTNTKLLREVSLFLQKSSVWTLIYFEKSSARFVVYPRAAYTGSRHTSATTTTCSG